MIFESRTNQLFVSDIAAKLEEVQAMIVKIDIPVRHERPERCPVAQVHRMDPSILRPRHHNPV